MKILLINHNPVVSRLTALSAKKEQVDLDEIQEVSELRASDYDIVFVDSENYNSEISNLLNNSGIEKKVLFFAQNEEVESELFNETILKPFLPSEVSAIIRKTKVEIHEKEQTAEANDDLIDLDALIKGREEHLNQLEAEPEITAAAVASTDQEEKFDLFEEPKLPVTEEPKVEEKPKVVEPSVEKDTFDLALDEAFPINFADEEAPKEEEKPKAVTSKEEKPESDYFSDSFEDEISSDETDTNLETKAFDDSLFELDEKETESHELFELDSSDHNKKENDLLDFDLDSSEEIDFEAASVLAATEVVEKKHQTKILDMEEVTNIRGLLNAESKEKETKEEPSEIVPEETAPANQLAGSELLAHTLGAMPVDELRRFLRGAKVHITIKFPKDL
ncbi:MAG: hypothetical protein IE889_03370 [Campylobacterales bacterium]|nr:hypothetical protein [Campylobacterales bacterium]